MTPTAARWIEASRDLTDARLAHQSAAQHERAAWAALQREVLDGTGGIVDNVSVYGRGRAGVPGGAGDGSVADSDRAEGGAT